MRKFLLVLLAVPTITYAQKDSTLYKAGKELISFKRTHDIGFGLELIGAGISIVGVTSNQTSASSSNTTVEIVGGVVALIGFFVEASSYKHIQNAGIILRGNGIAIPLQNKKKKKGWHIE